MKERIRKENGRNIRKPMKTRKISEKKTGDRNIRRKKYFKKMKEKQKNRKRHEIWTDKKNKRQLPREKQ